jgi:hypothetical protein
MEPDYSNRFGGGSAASAVHPAVAIVLLLTIVLMFLLPRKYVIVPVLLVFFLTPFGQQYYVAGVHLFVTRILILCGGILIVWAKLSSRENVFTGGFTVIDKLFVAWAISRALCTFLEFMQAQALLNQCGFLWDTIGGYFLFRYLVRDEDDIVRVLKTFAVIVCIFAVTMTGERLFMRNLFGYIGARMVPPVREGAIRAQATFEDPIRCGTFAATVLCLFAWLWQSARARVASVFGMVGGMVMVVMSASSTPLLAFLACIIAIFMWPFRERMRLVRWGLVIGLIALHLVMKAPVWFIIDHVDLIAGNSGYHRAMLIDQCIRHFNDWWLIGAKSTAGWAYEMGDQANQFVSEAEGGGLVTLVLFVWLISRSFGQLARARRLANGNREQEWLCWLLGGALFSFVVSFFGIAFASQEQFAWYLLFALICVATVKVTEAKGDPVAAPVTLRQPPAYALPSIHA